MNVNDAYELYCNSPTDENYAQLYKATLAYARKIGHDLLPELDRYCYRHASENAATTVLLTFSHKFNPEKASFSTWAHQSIRADLLDWRRNKFRILSRDSDYFKYVSEAQPDTLTTDDQLLLKQITANLSEEQRELLNDKVHGDSLEIMAVRFGVSVATIKRRWDALIEKAREVAVAQ